MTCGIYLIENSVSKNKYVGQSLNIEHRWQIHKWKLRGGTHPNYRLQKSWEKHGEEAFKFLVKETCPPDELDERESYYVRLYNSYSAGYNMTQDGRGTFNQTREERRTIIRAVNKKRLERIRYCLICGERTPNGMAKYCKQHKHMCKCKRTRIEHHGGLCELCKEERKVVLCAECGAGVERTSNRIKYCPECAKIVNKEKTKVRMKIARNR